MLSDKIKCDLCGNTAGNYRVIHYFAAQKLFGCSICTAASNGYSIAYAFERTFENHMAKWRVARPELNSHGLYALGHIDIWDVSHCDDIIRLRSHHQS